LDGAMDGVDQYLSVNTTQLWNPDSWKAAGTQVFWSYGIAMSMHVTMGSYNARDQKTLKLTIMQVILAACVSFCAGLMVFATLGFMAKEQNTTVDQVVRGGSGLVFIAIPTALNMMPWPRVWATIFFSMLFMLGVDGEFAILESVITAFTDTWGNFHKHQTKEEERRFHKIALVIRLRWHIFTWTDDDHLERLYVFNWLDYWGAGGTQLLSIGLCQCIALAYTYGAWRYWDRIKGPMALNKSWMVYFPYSWLYTTPLCIAATLVLFLKDGFPTLTTNLNHDPSFKYEYPTWSKALGCCFLLSSVIWTPLYAIYRYARSKPDWSLKTSGTTTTSTSSESSIPLKS